VLGVPEEASVRYYGVDDCPKPRGNLSRLVETAHVSQTRGEKTIPQRQTRIFLDHEAQFPDRLIKAFADEIRGTEISCDQPARARGLRRNAVSRRSIAISG